MFFFIEKSELFEKWLFLLKNYPFSNVNETNLFFSKFFQKLVKEVRVSVKADLYFFQKVQVVALGLRRQSSGCD